MVPLVQPATQMAWVLQICPGWHEPWVLLAGLQPNGGVTAAMQAPFRQVAEVAPGIEHNVPFAFGRSLPLWHFLPLFVCRHFPFLQVWHWLGFGLHLRDLAASASSARKFIPAMAATAPAASPRRAVSRLTRVVAMLLISWSNLVPSMTCLSFVINESRRAAPIGLPVLVYPVDVSFPTTSPRPHHPCT